MSDATDGGGITDAPASAVSDLQVTLVQADTIWHNAAANRERIARWLGERVAIQPRPDLIVLPETFSTGFSNDAIATAESMEGETVSWMRGQARAHDAAITGSVQIRVGDAVHNRLLWATPDGVVRHYDKRHLFRMAREQDWYAAGRERLVVEFRGWRICPLVCYDLRFPVFSRNGVDSSQAGALDYDLLLYVANWPGVRHDAWRTLLRARAIENLCYVVGVNRTGSDGNAIGHLGGSAVLDFLGQPAAECDAAPQVMDATISHDRLREYRRRFPAHLDADPFALVVA